MSRIHTRTVWQLTADGMELLEDHYYEHDGPVAECKKGGGGGPSPEEQELTRLSLERVKREEKEITEREAEKQRLLASGRVGRTSLLTGGFTGPGGTVRQARAETRAAERIGQRQKAAEQVAIRRGQTIEDPALRGGKGGFVEPGSSRARRLGKGRAVSGFTAAFGALKKKVADPEAAAGIFAKLNR